MDDFQFQRSIARQILRTRPEFIDGMQLVQRAIETRFPREPWGAIRRVRWRDGLGGWLRWMDQLVLKRPPPPIALVWFETPTELNPALTSVSGWTEPGGAEDGYGSEAPRAWPVRPDGFTALAGMHELPELEKALTLVGWRKRYPDATDNSLRRGVYALCYSYSLLLVLKGLPRTQFSRAREASGPLAVTTGWASGDIDPVGSLRPSGWSSFPRTRRPPRAVLLSATPPTDLEQSQPRKYLARGGDPRWSDPKTGESLLHLNRYGGIQDIRALVRAGADVNAVDKRGDSVLHALGAAELPVLRLLLAHGADARARSKRGCSVLDRIVDDGRCTVSHLALFARAGAKCRLVSPVHNLANVGLFEPSILSRLGQMFRYWIRRGKRVNRADPKGRTPLWIALGQHAWELREHREWLKTRAPNPGVWNYRHDRVAMLLLDLGADPNARIRRSGESLLPRGATPLMVRRYDDDRLVRALLKRGADPFATCASGKTALDYAREAARHPKLLGHAGAADVVAVLERAMRSGPPRPDARSRLHSPCSLGARPRVPRR